MSVRTSVTLLAATAALVGGALAAAPAAGAATADGKAASAQTCHTQSTIGLTCRYHYGKEWAERGSTGLHVKEIQALIKRTTPYTEKTGKKLAVDGDFGPATESAVKWFQRYYMGASAVDGIVGPRTWEALRIDRTPA
ncbi:MULTISPECIES: peptidoglycan-binding domain-containing protein [unclassified Streptomyces]|uniref:peptidoglycan-binding domain-containing protein n=1 Tax=unclassified Streptomyces TaxID=2593676 RepID=UPI001661D445|nr:MULTISPECIES: peptidoglycan-binding protein [unclassified Streptomyces]MBD0839285.1 peptidoglycan-binding protein [Streptomyces sp. TRM68416]